MDILSSEKIGSTETFNVCFVRDNEEYEAIVQIINDENTMSSDKFIVGIYNNEEEVELELTDEEKEKIFNMV